MSDLTQFTAPLITLSDQCEPKAKFASEQASLAMTLLEGLSALTNESLFPTVAPAAPVAEELVAGTDLAPIADAAPTPPVSHHSDAAAAAATATPDLAAADDPRPTAASPAASRLSCPPEGPTPTHYTSSRREYAPALQDRTLAEALVAFHRQGLPTPSSRILRKRLGAAGDPQPAPPEQGFRPLNVPEVTAEPKQPAFRSRGGSSSYPILRPRETGAKDRS